MEEAKKFASLMRFKFRKTPGFSMSWMINFNLRTCLFSLPRYSLYSLKSRSVVSRFYYLLPLTTMKTGVFDFSGLPWLTFKTKFLNHRNCLDWLLLSS